MIGSSRQTLILQFLREAGIISTIAAGLALLLGELIEPVFYYYMGKNFSLLPGEMLPFFLGLAGITFLVGILAGAYPAFFLAGFQPMAVLKQTFHGGSRGTAIRKVLVILQFAITIIVMIATLTVYRQIRFMKMCDLGFKSSQILVIPSGSYLTTLAQMEIFKNALSSHPAIQNISLLSYVPGKIYNQDIWAEFGKQDKGIFPLYEILTDYGFIDTMV